MAFMGHIRHEAQKLSKNRVASLIYVQFVVKLHQRDQQGLCLLVKMKEKKKRFISVKVRKAQIYKKI